MAVPFSEGFWADIEGVGKLQYSPASDSIHVFEDPRFNHICFWNEEHKTITWQFMGQVALDALHQAGLPHTIRDSITQAEYDAWADWTADCESVHLDEELDALLDDNGG